MNDLSNRGALGQKQIKERFTPLEGRYYAWLHLNGMCCLTGYKPFEIAHTGKKHTAMKAPLRTCLLLRKELHMLQEKYRAEFWDGAGFPDSDRFDWSIRLFEMFEKNEDPTPLLMDMAGRANRDYLMEVLAPC